MYEQNIARLQQRRQQRLAERAAIMADVERRGDDSLDAEESALFRQLTQDIQQLDRRIDELTEEDSRGLANTEGARAVRQAQAQGGGWGRQLSGYDEDIAHAFRSALLAKNPAPIEIGPQSQSERRTFYNPGLEYRDTLKTTATQALPVSVYGQVMRHLVENSAILAAGATVLTTDTGEDLQVPKDTAFVTSNLITEGSSITESDPTLAVVTLKAYKYASFFQISQELANDTPTNLLAYLADQAGQSLALTYGVDLVTGNGTGKPRGLVNDAGVGKTGPTGTATTLGTQTTAGQGTDCLYDLIGSLAEPYSRQPSTGFLLTNASLAICRKLKDSSGQPVAGMVGGALNAAVAGAPSGNNVILGYPAHVDPNVAAMAANAKSIYFGDFSKFFVRVVRGVRFERSDEYAFQSDLVSFRCIIRLDGALVDSNAIKVFVNSAT